MNRIRRLALPRRTLETLGDIYMNLIQTCQRNEINPWDFLTELQRSHQAVKESPEEWVPWKYQETHRTLRRPMPEVDTTILDPETSARAEVPT